MRILHDAHVQAFYAASEFIPWYHREDFEYMPELEYVPF